MLNDLGIKSAKPKDKAYKLTDGRGMYLLVNPNGGKLWRLDYRFSGKRKTLALGAYPEISLAKARERLDEARRLLADGVDPMEDRKASREAEAERGKNSFEAVTREWLATNKGKWAGKLAVLMGFCHEGGKGSHRVFKRNGEPVQLNFQNRDGYIPPYQARQLVEMVKKYGESDEPLSN